jgi:two-component system, cell cycle sensor histidine kinase and response regulator CckA
MGPAQGHMIIYLLFKYPKLGYTLFAIWCSRMCTERPTILVVDDEPLVRKFLYDILTGAGYRVLEGHFAENALRLCQQHPNPIHLLLTDINMPDMNGRALTALIRGLRPEIRVLFISSDEDGLPATGPNSKEDSAFLLKPFSPDTLRWKVRELLGAPSQ